MNDSDDELFGAALASFEQAQSIDNAVLAAPPKQRNGVRALFYLDHQSAAPQHVAWGQQQEAAVLFCPQQAAQHPHALGLQQQQQQQQQSNCFWQQRQQQQPAISWKRQHEHEQQQQPKQPCLMNGTHAPLAAALGAEGPSTADLAVGLQASTYTPTASLAPMPPAGCKPGDQVQLRVQPPPANPFAAYVQSSAAGHRAAASVVLAPSIAAVAETAAPAVAVAATVVEGGCSVSAASPALARNLAPPLAPALAPAPAAAPAVPAPAPAAAAGKRRLMQQFDFLLVLDLESTCDRDKEAQAMPQEIIEVSCVLVDTASLQLRPATFQRYVRPDQHPRLSAFCTELTGVSQAMVNGGVPLRVALADLEGWLREQGLIGGGKKGRTFVPVTWRDWDLKVQMALECKWRGIQVPKFFLRWIDICAVWTKHSGGKRGNLKACVQAAGLQWEGRAHSAIDDARNTARLAVKLMQSGVILGVTGSFTGVDASGRFKQSTLFAASSKGPAGKGGLAMGQPPPAKKKHKVFDEGGAWKGQCFCGATAKKRQVKKPGPNNGRFFWSCGKFSMTGGGAQCDFMKWAEEVAEPPPPPPAAAGGTKSGRAGWR
ncbi:hypothetical protein D9Q98_008188 [Chlorella vulgaris]|uniref:GRF-type domain-containing protein n=1 Tax=Chlorella vulgaris TaxID=3077 RepID=A0A9D4TG79_CHLVU|nr:hypothetical protein D9Q98_008188 [Chlorella vulgaris]